MLKKIFTGLSAILLLAGSGCSCGKKNGVVMEKNAILIDVRSVEEYNSGFLKGAVNIPHTLIGDRIGSIAPDKKTPLYLYCRSGRRVGVAMESLKAGGYTVMYNLGGLEEARRKLDLPVVKP